MKRTIEIELPDDEHCSTEDILCPFVDFWESLCSYFNEGLYTKNDKTLKCEECLETFRKEESKKAIRR